VLELSGPRPSWRGAAYEGWLAASVGDQLRVLALLGPDGLNPDALVRAQRSAAVAMTLRHPGVLRLLQVVAHEGRAAWCYEPTHGLGLIHLVGSAAAAELPARAAAELVAQVAESLLGLGSVGLHHPGPEPADLVLGANGAVRVAGFAGPYPPSPSMRAPEGSGGEAAAVYRLGVLLASLASGAAPSPTTDPSAHGVAIRRALIGAMARPGPVLSERYGQWMRGMLAWAPTERPPLSSVPAGLRAVAWATGGESLADWAARRVPDLVASIEARGAATGPDATPGSPPSNGGVGAVQLNPPPRRPGPRERPGDDAGTPLEDDRTQEHTVGAGGDADAGDAVVRGSRAARDAAIPVGIGPPPQVLSRLPTLPTGFLDRPHDGGASMERDGVTFNDLTRPIHGISPTLLGVIIGLLLVVVLLLLVLLFGDGVGRPAQAPPDGPGLDAAVERGTVPAAEPEPDVPAPGGVVEPEPDLSDLVDTAPPDGAEGGGADPSVERATPGSAGAVAGSGPHRVLFRLSPGLSGLIHVRCAGMRERASGARQVEVRGLSDGQECRVWAVSPGRERVEHRVRVSGPGTIVCFHDWGGTCLE
jgi:hypothetical protein